MSNIFFLFNFGYFDDGSASNIFLHTWSLSVEEQFYLVWPIFLIVLYKFRSPLVAIIGVFILSAITAYLLTSSNPLFAFYMMPARIFQFAIGAVIAIWGLNRKTVRQELFFNRLLKSNSVWLLGLAAILTSCFIADGSNYNFWLAAFIPVCGAALIITSIESRLSKKLLGSKIMRHIGQRAYSVYLVHWPLIVMSSVYLGSNKAWYVNILIGVFSFVLAELLFRLVEQPCRLKRSDTEHKFRSKTAFGFTLLVGSLVGVHLLHNYTKRGNESIRLEAQSDQNLSFSETDARNIGVPYSTFTSLLWAERKELGKIDAGCQLENGAPYNEFQVNSCVSLNKGDNTIIILGDSFAPETYIILSQFLPERSLSLAGGGGCPPIFPNPEWINTNSGAGCAELNSNRFRWAENENISAIVLATNWKSWNESDIHSTLTKLKDTRKPIIVMGVRPVFSEQIPSLLDSIIGKKAGANLNPYFDFDPFEKNDSLSSIVKSYGNNFKYIDVMKYLCSETCQAFTEKGQYIYLDTAHIAAGAAATIGKKVADEDGENLKNFLTLDFSKTTLTNSVEFVFEKSIFSPTLAEGVKLTNGTRFEPTTYSNQEAFLVSETNQSAQPSNVPGGVSIRLSRALEEAFSEKQVTIKIRAAGVRDGAEVGVAYSTSEVGNSGWRKFALTTEFQNFSFDYFVPKLKNGLGDFIGIRSYGDDEVVVKSISIYATSSTK